MKPCDCHDAFTAQKLNEQGMSHNEWEIILRPSSVFISNNTTTLRIPQKRFKAFAEWYLEDQG